MWALLRSAEITRWERGDVPVACLLKTRWRTEREVTEKEVSKTVLECLTSFACRLCDGARYTAANGMVMHAMPCIVGNTASAIFFYFLFK